MRKNKIKWNYQTAKVALYTLLVLDVISLSSVPESTAKYYSTKTNALAFHADLYQLYKENRITLYKPNYETSTLETADFTFSFPRNVIGEFKKTDEYEIIIPQGCSIQSITTNGTVSGNKISYTNANTDTTRVSMQCTVNRILMEDSAGQKFLDFDLFIKEKIDDEKQFVYTDRSYLQIYSQYVANIKPKPIEDEVPPVKVIKESETNKYNTFMEWIEKYARQVGHEKAIVQYVKDNSVEGDYESIKKLELPGLEVAYDKDTDSYIYTASDNLIGYAEMHIKDTNEFMFFSTTNANELEKAFEYYLKNKFLSEYENPEKENLFNMIVSYIKTFDERGIAYILLPDENGEYREIKGIKVTEASQGTEVQQVIVDKILIFDYAYNKINKVIRMSFDYNAAMRAVFQDNLPIVYDDNIISKATIGTLPTYAELRASITKNGTQNAPTEQDRKSFSDYFIIPDDTNNHNLLINIYSNVSEDATDKYNYAKVSILNYENFVFTEKRSTFKVSAKDKDTLIEFVEALDKIYNKQTILSDSDFTIGSSLISIEYSTIKQSTPVISGGQPGADPDVDADIDTNPDEENPKVDESSNNQTDLDKDTESGTSTNENKDTEEDENTSLSDTNNQKNTSDSSKTTTDNKEKTPSIENNNKEEVDSNEDQ